MLGYMGRLNGEEFENRTSQKYYENMNFFCKST